MYKRMKLAGLNNAINLKTEGGVRIKHMQNFFLHEGFSYSLEEVARFTRESGGVE